MKNNENYSLLSKEDKNLILNKFNNTYTAYPRNKTTIDLFEKTVNEYPDNIAIVADGKSLTYKQFDQIINKIANSLPQKKQNSLDIIAIYMTRRVEILASMLAAWKAGYTYICIDEKYPLERVQYMLDDAQAVTLISEKILIDKIKFDGEFNDIDQIDSLESTYHRDIYVDTKDIALLIYTSGSTGNPKGVMLSHQNIMNFSYWYKDKRELKSGDQIAEYASFSFDACIMGTYPVLIVGGTVHILPEHVRMSLEELDKYFYKNKIKGCFLTTQLGEQYLRAYNNEQLDFIEVGGEKLKEWTERSYNFINGYGPTESTVYVTDFQVDKNYQNIPVGKPLSNVQIYIVDNELKLCPVGVPGELCIAGESLALGYFNKQDQTKEKFIDNPFKYDGDQRITKDILYKTGDLAIWREDGNIEIQGRIDFQVKIRGFRIELGEIEARLASIENIDDVAVVALDDNKNNKYLCGYYISDKNLDNEFIIEQLSQYLPDYMIPEIYIKMEKFPLTPNGKVDRKSLPSPDVSALQSEYIAPRDEAEQIIVNEVESILEIDRISVLDNFFKLGGSSILAISLVSAISKKGYQISVADILANPIIQDFAKCLQEKSPDHEIIHAPKLDKYPVTSSQKGIYVTDFLGNQGTTYNIPLCLKIFGDIDKEQIGLALDKLIQRHESLRTSFEYTDDAVVQNINTKSNVSKQYKKISAEELDITIRDFIKPFKLSETPLFRVCLLEISRDYHVLLFDFHHIIFDGTSVEPFVRELFDLYDGIDLGELSVQYKDYAYWYKNFYIKSESYKNTRDYWIKQIDGASEIEFPFDYLKSSNMSSKANYLSKSIDDNLKKTIFSYCQELDITPYMLMMGVYSLLLSRYSRQNDITVGTATTGRTNSCISEHIGMFVHTLPFRVKIDDVGTISEYFNNIKSLSLNLLKNQNYNFEQLVQDADIKSSSGGLPLINFFFNYLEKNLKYNGNSFRVDVDLPRVKESMFDLTLTLQSTNNDSLEATIQYKKELFESTTIENFLNYYLNLLKLIVNSEKSKQLKDLELIGLQEKKTILNEFNDTHINYPKDKTVIDMFDKIVEKYPTNIALTYKGKVLTYQELNEQANAIANYLLSNTKEDFVAILSDNNHSNMIIAILGVLKSGKAYVPISPEFPLDRKIKILESSSAKILLSNKEYISSELQQNYKGNIVCLDDRIDTSCSEKPSVRVSTEQPAYVIYTSGSTGEPKGVEVQHKALSNFCYWYIDEYNVRSDSQILKYAGVAFDVSISEIFPTIVSGANLHFSDKSLRLSPDALAEYINKNNISHIFMPPAIYEQFANKDVPCLQYLITAGDKLKHYQPSSYQLVNAYGPTEATVYATTINLDKGYLNIPIGKPIKNYRVYILDKNFNICPIGVPGELCIAGDGLAKGYLNQPELTEKVFMFHDVLDERIYRTGDLARWKSDGNIEFLGRIDFQVKIRGYRMELGEIETRLANIKEIQDAVVLALDDKNNNKYLCGYYTAESDFDNILIQEELAKQLPNYMIPDLYVKLDKFPLTPNGKIDRKNLPEPDLSALQSEYIAPRNEIEKKIATIWSDIIGINQIGIDDSFFSIGGNSIKAIAVISALQSEGLKLSISDIFDYKTIRNITENVNINEFDINLKFDQIILANESNPGEQSRELVALEINANKRIEYLYDKLDSVDISKLDDVNTVLVTGATGFLGGHILNELIKINKRIIAIVRGKDDDDALKRTKEKLYYYFGDKLNKKFEDGSIKIYAGDLSKDNLGLSDNAYSDTLTNIQSIIHTAANVSHYGEYEKFYNDNVLPVKNLLDISRQNKKISFHYISTRSVCELGSYQEKNIVFNEADIPKLEGIDSVYIKTKLEGEYETVKARSEGINANIYRVGNLVYNSETLKHQQNLKDNGFFQTVTSILNIGEVFDGYSAEMSCINDTARAICTIFDKKNLYNGIYHTYSNNITNLDDILIDNQLGLSIERISFVDFVNSIRNKYNLATFSAYIQDFMLHYGWLGDGDHTTFTIQQNYTSEVLDRLGFKWTEINPLNIANMVKDAYSSRMKDFKKFEIFNKCSEETVMKLAKKAKLYSFDTGKHIIETGEKADSLYLLQRGFASLNITSPGGWQSNIGIVADNDHIGIDSICNSEYFLTVEAIVNDCCIYKVPKEDLLSIDKEELCKILYNLLKIETESSNSIANLLTLMG
ncbi:D-alanine--poly(phosphoribitol) ligase, subunit 1 [Francisella philomiragia subsp. philomiragia ATCC 25015]|uniref:non-ribosomal peptide synthetase n=1 Tax=Francisella philomiragia TaxID=28110 RepID=UPI0001AF7717|nr:non-ribosomal peptide synthetase [Francisella philomiragia]AJI75373.1 D-alanine--poly(phosphoribitol) ligase, subunit 1 [Francisella philomiragia subsp. philomiragia ATCC 25015]MBK2238984.1 non-ribosomal peptide synthetase [Francisella philomiragia]